MEQSYVYILFNEINGTIYTGVTSNLAKRVWEHKNNIYPKSFTAKYNVHKLGYYEVHSNIKEAISREKQIKKGTRKNKLQLIEKMNPYWNDLYNEIEN